MITAGQRIITIYVPFGDLKMFCTLIPAFKDLCVEFVNVQTLHCSSLYKPPTNVDINYVGVEFIALWVGKYVRLLLLLQTQF